MKKLKKYAVFFAIGSVGYILIELLWRGRSHWSMGIAGGLSFILFSVADEKFKEKPLILKAALVAVGITLIEFAFGVVFNIFLGMKIWDYSDVPLNLLGQICPRFSVMWCALAALLLPLAGIINEAIDKKIG